jgi:radical SAM superfamily enzyme YgiQ (UPF0313 family)
MKILLVNPDSLKHGFRKKQGKKIQVPMYKLVFNTSFKPNLSILTLAALTPKENTVEIVDDTIEEIDIDGEYDIIGISSLTCTAIRAYEIADEFRKRGKTVVLGGWHPSVLPEEAKQHADSVVIGEAEELWSMLLNDYKNGKLKPFYKQTKRVDISLIPPILKERNLLKYVTFPEGVEATRGCTVGCKFCPGTNKIFYREYRKRPIDDVIQELKFIKKRYIAFVDNSLTFHPGHTKKLFKEMKGLNKKFYAMANISTFENDDELLKLAADAGMMQVNLGLESPSQKSLDSVGKITNKVETYASTIKKIHDYGIGVLGCFLFGFETDTIDIFKRTIDFVKEIDLDFAYFMILTPYPGTPFYNQFEAENRILTKDWSKYDLDHVVFKPKNMTPEELLSGIRGVVKEYTSPFNIIKRIVKSTQVGFYPFLSVSTLSLLGYRYGKYFINSRDFECNY